MGFKKRKMTLDHSSINDRDGVALNSIGSKKGSKDNRKSPKLSGPFNARPSPLNFQVKKSFSKKHLRMSPSASSSKMRMNKSPSLDHPQHASSTNRGLRGTRNGIVTSSHQTNLNASMVHQSNRGIITMSSRNGLRSGTVRVKSGRKRSAMSNRSTDSIGGVPPSNDAVNQYYDKNLGRAYDRFK